MRKIIYQLDFYKHLFVPVGHQSEAAIKELCRANKLQLRIRNSILWMVFIIKKSFFLGFSLSLRAELLANIKDWLADDTGTWH